MKKGNITAVHMVSIPILHILHTALQHYKPSYGKQNVCAWFPTGIQTAEGGGERPTRLTRENSERVESRHNSGSGKGEIGCNLSAQKVQFRH